MLRPTLLVDGQIQATWHLTRKTNHLNITLTPSAAGPFAVPRVTFTFSVTSGRPVRTWCTNASLNRRHARSSTPARTASSMSELTLASSFSRALMAAEKACSASSLARARISDTLRSAAWRIWRTWSDVVVDSDGAGAFASASNRSATRRRC